MLSTVAPGPHTRCLCEVIHIWSSLLLLIITHHYYKQVQSWLPSFWLPGKKRKQYFELSEELWRNNFEGFCLAVTDCRPVLNSQLSVETLGLNPCAPDTFILIDADWRCFDGICLMVGIARPPPNAANRPEWQTELPCAMWPQTSNQMRSGNLISVSHLGSFENNHIWSRVIERERH